MDNYPKIIPVRLSYLEHCYIIATQDLSSYRIVCLTAYCPQKTYPYVFTFKTEFFFLPKQNKKSRSLLLDGSRALGLFRKGKTQFIAKFDMTALVICSRSKEEKRQSYSQINTVR